MIIQQHTHHHEIVETILDPNASYYILKDKDCFDTTVCGASVTYLDNYNNEKVREILQGEITDYRSFDQALKQIYHNFAKHVVLHSQIEILEEETLDMLDSLGLESLSQMLYFNCYFQKTYLLNVSRRHDRLYNMIHRLFRNCIIDYEIWTGYDGSQEPYVSEWNDYMKKILTPDELAFRKKGIRSSGSWAILKSMRDLFNHCKSVGYENVLVLQDDLLFHRDFLKNFYHTMRHNISDWKLLYLGAGQHIWPEGKIRMCDGYYFANGTADGAYANAFDSSIYDFVITEIEKFNISFDSGPLRATQRKYPDMCPILYPNLMIIDLTESDLRPSRDQDKFGGHFKWNMGDYSPKVENKLGMELVGDYINP